MKLKVQPQEKKKIKQKVIKQAKPKNLNNLHLPHLLLGLLLHLKLFLRLPNLILFPEKKLSCMRISLRMPWEIFLINGIPIFPVRL
jgi:hypothetical protein